MINTIKEAILNNNTHFKGIKLPTRQTSGTDHQIITYAYIQAQKFLEDNINELNK